MVIVINPPSLLTVCVVGLYVTAVCGVRLVDEVPKYTVRIFASSVPEFIISTTIFDELLQFILETVRNCPIFPVWLEVNVITQAYVTMIAATAITINKRVASIGEIPFFDLSILVKFSQLALPFLHFVFNKYEPRINIINLE